MLSSFLDSNQKIPIKKSWGQNFIIDKNIINKIIAIIKPDINEHIIEIGPGKGALTLPIAKISKKITCIEIDPLLCKYLKHKEIPNLEIINKDFLDFKLDFKSPKRVIGNLPYYISSPIIFKLIKNKNISEFIIMIQKELADRICAEPNCKDYSRISIMAQTFCDVSYECSISRNIFNPKPKVNSSIIRLKKKNIDIDLDKFLYFIKVAFRHRRKKVINNLKTEFPMMIKDEIFIDKRPENISVNDYIEIFNKYSF